jgi:hypothetical protein
MIIYKTEIDKIKTAVDKIQAAINSAKLLVKLWGDGNSTVSELPALVADTTSI